VESSSFKWGQWGSQVAQIGFSWRLGDEGLIWKRFGKFWLNWGEAVKGSRCLCRHGILYNSSASQKRESTGFRKISMIFTLFRMIFNSLNVSYYVEKTKSCSNQHNYVEILQKFAFHNLSLMNSTFSSTI
jgi:hypothetical protein